MRCKTKGRVGEVSLKINISKTFDRVQWKYLLGLMAKKGFNEKWLGLIQMFLESVLFLSGLMSIMLVKFHLE